MEVNGAFRPLSINSPFMGKGKPRQKAKPDTAPARPLFDWFAEQKERRRKFVGKMGYSDGRITNWKKRGIPLAELGRIAHAMGITYDEYMAFAGVAMPKIDGPVSPNIEEAHAIRRLRQAIPAYRSYVLSLALMESHERQQLFLDIMQTHVPNKAVEKAYGEAPHVTDRRREKERR